MKITLLVVGKTTDTHIEKLIQEYQKRLVHYVPFALTVIPELKNTKSLTSQQQKQVEEMQNSVKVGDSILLNSGMYGKVMDIIGDTLIVEFGLNKSVRIPVLKSTVARVAEPNLTVGKKAEMVDENGVEYEYVEVEVEVDENGNEIGEVKKEK